MSKDSKDNSRFESNNRENTASSIIREVRNWQPIKDTSREPPRETPKETPKKENDSKK